MRVLHLAAGNRWTGAAAPAFAEVEALRAAGVDAHYAYVGGYKLQSKIGHFAFAHPIIAKTQNPFTFAKTASAIGRLISEYRFDVLHAHLTWDHWLSRMASRHRDVAIARTFHARRVLRSDPLTRLLVAKTGFCFVINQTFGDARVLAGKPTAFTPPAVDLRQFSPEGNNARSIYGIPPAEKLVTVIGKLSPGRGFEDAFASFRLIRKDAPSARLMVIGHGEHRPRLEVLAQEMGIGEAIVWAGYHEEDLAEHYRASDLLLFTAAGSDEGHRAILEAMACGVPVATYPLAGVAALTPASMIAGGGSPEALAAHAIPMLRGDRAPLRSEVAARAQQFGYGPAAARLISVYQSVRAG